MSLLRPLRENSCPGLWKGKILGTGDGASLSPCSYRGPSANPVPTWNVVFRRNQSPRRMPAVLCRTTLPWGSPANLASTLLPRVSTLVISSQVWRELICRYAWVCSTWE